MIIYKNGDLLKSDCNIIAHQVNVYGIMGGGIATQIAKKYPECLSEYREYCKSKESSYVSLQGDVYLYQHFPFKNKVKTEMVMNLFSQDTIPILGTVIDYHALRICLQKLKIYAKERNLSAGIPHGIGCGIAGGDWNVVSKIIEDIFNDYNVYAYKYSA